MDSGNEDDVKTKLIPESMTLAHNVNQLLKKVYYRGMEIFQSNATI